SMSINSGQRYKITTEHHELSIDLSAADHKSILGHTFHGGENQLWMTEKHVNGQWTIRSVEHQKYLGIETSTPKNGTHLVGLEHPQFWDIEILSDSRNPTSKPNVKYVLSRTPLAIAVDVVNALTDSAIGSVALVSSPSAP
ncbi:hypothetical protein EDB83DRAFT_2222071, partial [Lactarius deliciosus]